MLMNNSTIRYQQYKEGCGTKFTVNEAIIKCIFYACFHGIPNKTKLLPRYAVNWRKHINRNFHSHVIFNILCNERDITSEKKVSTKCVGKCRTSFRRLHMSAQIN